MVITSFRTFLCRRSQTIRSASMGVAPQLSERVSSVLYANFLTSGTLHRHLAEIDQACNERMEIIISDMAKQDGVTETLKVADQMEWVRRMNSIRSRAEEIVLTELVYE